MRGGAEHAETAGAADGCNHVAAMAEGQQGEFNSQHVADRRFHGCGHSLRRLFGDALYWFVFANSRNDASASWARKPSGFPLRLSCVETPGNTLAARAVFGAFRGTKYAALNGRFVSC